jgi:hypothetical protein
MADEPFESRKQVVPVKDVDGHPIHPANTLPGAGVALRVGKFPPNESAKHGPVI